jgi:hypothetical protein
MLTGQRRFVESIYSEVGHAERERRAHRAMIHPQAWENERTVVEVTQPILVTEWAEKTDWEHERLGMLPYESLIEEGRYVGGHVLIDAARRGHDAVVGHPGRGYRAT